MIAPDSWLPTHHSRYAHQEPEHFGDAAAAIEALRNKATDDCGEITIKDIDGDGPRRPPTFAE